MDTLHPPPRGRVVGIYLQCLLILADSIIIESEILEAFCGIEKAPHLIHVGGVVIGERRVGPDGIIKVFNLLVSPLVVGIDGKNLVQLLPRLHILTGATVLLRKCHGGIGKVSFQSAATFRGGKPSREDAQGFVITRDGGFVVSLLVGLAARLKKFFRLSHFLCSTHHLSLGQVALGEDDSWREGEKAEGQGEYASRAIS